MARRCAKVAKGVVLVGSMFIGACRCGDGTGGLGELGFATFSYCPDSGVNCHSPPVFIPVGTRFTMEVELSDALPWDVEWRSIASASPAIISDNGVLQAQMPGDVALLALSDDGEVIDFTFMYVREIVPGGDESSTGDTSTSGTTSTTGWTSTTGLMTDTTYGSGSDSGVVETDTAETDTDADTDGGGSTGGSEDTAQTGTDGQGETETDGWATGSGTDGLTGTGASTDAESGDGSSGGSTGEG